MHQRGREGGRQKAMIYIYDMEVRKQACTREGGREGAGRCRRRVGEKGCEYKSVFYHHGNCSLATTRRKE